MATMKTPELVSPVAPVEDVSAEPRLFVSKEAAITVRQAWSPLDRRDRHAREEQAAGGHAWGSERQAGRSLHTQPCV